jgi:hypothetical protein
VHPTLPARPFGLTAMRTYVRVREYRYTVTEHDLEKPWLVIGQEHRTVRLDDDANFFEWAHRTWPEPRYTVQLDPWQLGVGLKPTT